MDILLTIRPFGAPAPIKSVEEGLATYFEQETLDGENQYQCDKCGKKTDATKGLRLRTVPYILSLQMHYKTRGAGTSPSSSTPTRSSRRRRCCGCSTRPPRRPTSCGTPR